MDERPAALPTDQKALQQMARAFRTTPSALAIIFQAFLCQKKGLLVDDRWDGDFDLFRFTGVADGSDRPWPGAGEQGSMSGMPATGSCSTKSGSPPVGRMPKNRPHGTRSPSRSA